MKRIHSVLGIMSAVCIPVATVAALEIPNTFEAGDPVSASSMNANFDAVKAEVEALQTTVQELKDELSSETALSLASCEWHRNQCDGPGVCTAECPAGMHPISGACDGANAGLMESYPAASPFPNDTPHPVTDFDRWICESATGGDINHTNVLCCPVD